MRRFVAWTLYLSLFFFALVGIVTIGCVAYAKFLAPDTQVRAAQAEKTSVIQPPPKSVETNAYLFSFLWFTVNPNETPEKKLEQLDSYITSNFKEELQDHPDFFPKATVKGKEPKVAGAYTDDVGWIEPGNKAYVRMRVDFEDGRSNYFRIPMEKTGETYRVSGIPALIPPPKTGAAKPTPEVDLGDEKEAITSTLNNFFTAWLAGNQEMTQRYTETPLPSANLLKDMAALYRSVSIEPVSDDPVQVKAYVVIEDGNQNTFTLEYLVTLEQSGGTWKIKDLFQQ